MGAIQMATNRPFQRLMNGGRRVPGLPSVALGYDWLAHFVGYGQNVESPARWYITSAALNRTRVPEVPRPRSTSRPSTPAASVRARGPKPSVTRSCGVVQLRKTSRAHGAQAVSPLMPSAQTPAVAFRATPAMVAGVGCVPEWGG